MGYGLLIKNDDNITQIDQDFFNLSLRAKFAVNSMTASNFYLHYVDYTGLSVRSDVVFVVVDYPSSGDAVLAIQPPANRAIVPIPYDTNINFGNAQYDIPAGHNRRVFMCDGATALTLTCYVFDRVNAFTSSPTGYGFVVRNANNEIVFDHRYPVIKPKGAAILRGNNVGQSIALASNRAYALVFADWDTGAFYATGPNPRYLQKVSMALTSNAMILGQIRSEINSSALGAGSYAEVSVPALGLIIDVTYL